MPPRTIRLFAALVIAVLATAPLVQIGVAPRPFIYGFAGAVFIGAFVAVTAVTD